MQFGQLRRREFITLLGGAAAWPIAAHAQQVRRIQRIGVLIGGIENNRVPLAKFWEELEGRGWTGQSLQIDFRFATDINQMKSLVAQLVELAPDVLFTNNTPAVLAMREKAKTTPIVFVIVTDPVSSGFGVSVCGGPSRIDQFARHASSLASDPCLPLWGFKRRPCLLRPEYG